GCLRSTALPNLRLVHAPLNPEREQRWQHADEKHRTPTPAWQDEPGDDRRGAGTDCPCALDEPQRFAAMFGGKIFRPEGLAPPPLAAHADTQTHTEHGDLQ